MLWRNPDITLAKIARRYQAGPRAIQRWSKEWGLPRKDALGRFGDRAASIAVSAQDMVTEVKSAAKIALALVKAEVKPEQRPSKSEITGPIHPLGPGGQLQEENWNPLNDKEIKTELEAVKQEARQITQHSDLTALQRRCAKLMILVSTKMPGYTWESLQDILDSLSRTVLWARKVEGGLPPPEPDQVLLRKEVGAQLMHELRAVLSPEDQAALAKLVQVGADRILARKGRMPDKDRPLS